MELEVKNIHKAFKKNKVLQGVDYKFVEGKIYALLGRNGAGKTTFFNIITDQLKQDEGIATLDGKKIENDDIFLLIAEPTLPNFLTGREFIKFVVDVNKKRDVDIDKLFRDLQLEDEDTNKLIKDYSIGMKNKLQMIMMMIIKPKIILMDEPLSNLDIVVQLEMKKFIKEIKNDHIIIFSTHIMQLAQDICDNVVILHNGKFSDYEEWKSKENFEEEILKILKEEKNE